MPLPPSTVARKLLHTRTIVCRGHIVGDRQWEMEGSIADVKTCEVTPGDCGAVAPGMPVHSMSVRMFLDRELTIQKFETVTDHAPNRICPAILPNFQRLVGLSLAKGFRKSVRARVGGTEGCVHIVDLLSPLATTTYQTANFERNQAIRAASQRGEPTRPPFLDTCHTWATTSPVVKRELPSHYTGD